MVMSTITPIKLPEIWMELRDRTLLAELMETHNVSARQMSREVGWKSHTYMQRLLRGQAKNVEPVAAARIAYRLKVPFNLLFATRVSGEPAQSARKKVA